MDGTLIAIGAGGALPESAVGWAAGSSPIWIDSPARRGRRAGRTEQEDNTRGSGFSPLRFVPTRRQWAGPGPATIPCPCS